MGWGSEELSSSILSELAKLSVSDIFKHFATAVTMAMAIVGLFEIGRRLRRFARYRSIRRFFRFRSGQRLLLICSELDDPKERQWVEDDEFIYLMKYGDVDALFDISLLIREVYPDIRLEIMSSEEASTSSLDFACDMIVIGGPDYNSVCKRLHHDNHTRIIYSVPDWSLPEASPRDISLVDRNTDERWCLDKKTVDYGYIEVINNPYSKKSRIFIFGGCHTIGVTGAVRAFQLNRKDSPGPSEQTYANLKALNRYGLFRESFGAVFQTSLIGSSIPAPSLVEANFFGAPRKLWKVPLPNW